MIVATRYCIASALALLLCNCATSDYVPDTGWHDNEWASEFYEAWFGSQLRAMDEPPLTSSANLKGFRSRYRLLILPSFRPASAYRVDWNADGSAILRTVTLNGAGGYEPGRIAQQHTSSLETENTNELEVAIRQASLDTLPREEEPEGMREVDGELVIAVCFDGTTYVIEYLTVSNRHYLTRRCDIEEPVLRNLVSATTALVPEQDIHSQGPE